MKYKESPFKNNSEPTPLQQIDMDKSFVNELLFIVVIGASTWLNNMDSSSPDDCDSQLACEYQAFKSNSSWCKFNHVSVVDLVSLL